MPFDGTVFLRAPVVDQRRPPVPWPVLFICALVVFVIGGELLFPDRGPLILLVEGPTALKQNMVARDIWRDARRLEFTVGAKHYTVVSPAHALTGEQQTAWLGFAQRKRLPLYSVDGPSAVDP